MQLHKTEQAWKPAVVIKDDAADPEAIKLAVRQLAISGWTELFLFVFCCLFIELEGLVIAAVIFVCSSRRSRDTSLRLLYGCMLATVKM